MTLSLTRDRYVSHLKSQGVSKEKKKTAYKRWPEELAADLIGLNLCLKLSDEPTMRQVICGSIDLVLLTMILLEKLFEKKHGIQYYAHCYERGDMDHPPSKLRLEFIKSYVNELLPDTFGVLYEDLTNFVVSNMY